MGCPVGRVDGCVPATVDLLIDIDFVVEITDGLLLVWWCCAMLMLGNDRRRSGIPSAPLDVEHDNNNIIDKK